MKDKIYRTAKIWKIISNILLLILTFPFGFLLVTPLMPIDSELKVDSTVYLWFFVPFSIVMLSVVVVAFANINKGKFIISRNKVSIKGIFNNKQLYFNDIKGYRETEHYTYIESKNSNEKIKLHGYFENQHEILEWLKSNYKNLSEIEENQENAEFLKNIEYGWTIEERGKKLQTARKISKILNWLGGFFAIGTILLLSSFKYVILLCIAYPIICLVIIVFFKGLIRIDERSNSVYPTLFWAFFATTSVLFLRALGFFNIFDYSNIWLPTILIALIFFLVLRINHNKEFVFYKSEKNSSIFMLFLFIILSYSYGTVINLNCVLDNSNPQIFRTTILRKRIDSGRNINYYLKLEKWNNQMEPKEVSVTKDFYDKNKTNDTIGINFRKGKLNISWFELHQ